MMSVIADLEDLVHTPDKRKQRKNSEGKMAWEPTHRHRASGTPYRVIGLANMQSSAAYPLLEGERFMVYEGENRAIWICPEREFHDGRFEEL